MLMREYQKLIQGKRILNDDIKVETLIFIRKNVKFINIDSMSIKLEV